MVNAQLLDYIENQLKVGVGREVIRSTLLESGWPDADVREALDRAKPDNGGAGGGTIKTTDIFQPAGEPVFRPTEAKEAGSSRPPKTSKAGPSAGGATGIATAIFDAEKRPIASSGVSARPRSWVKWLVYGAGGAVVIAAAGSAYFFYDRSGDAESRLALLERENTSLAAEAAAAKSSGAQDKENLQNQLLLLGEENEALKVELGIFRLPAGSDPGTTETVTVKGALEGGEKGPYSIRTVNDIVVYVKNSSNSGVAAALAPLVGSTIEISGTHLLGSRDITVTTVNGTEIGE